MKKIVKYISIIAVAAMSAACMNLDPQNQLSDPQVWSKAENYTLFANQFYGYLRGFKPSDSVNYMNGLKDGPHSDLRSDLICGGDINPFSAGTNTIPSKDDNYNNLYNRIYRTNLLLARAAEYGFSESSIPEAAGEAHFFRAYLHFELVQLYGNCLLVLEPMDVTSKELFMPRTPRLQVVNAIVEDLKAAAQLLPETPSEAGRLCKDAAWSMLSRVALYEGTWQKFHIGKGTNTEDSRRLLDEASAAAAKVIEGGRYQLFHSDQLGDRDSYRYMFILEDVQCNPAGLTKSSNTEYILARRYHETLKHIEYEITHGTFRHKDQTPTSKLADMFRCQDGLPIDKSPLFKGYASTTSEFENRDLRMNAVMPKPGQIAYDNDSPGRTTWTDDEPGTTVGPGPESGYNNYKWSAERQCHDSEESYDYPVIRYAEVLLNYAEAKFEAEDKISDADLDLSLNVVRARCNPSMTKLSNALAANNGLDMREEIRAERSIELILEGFRIDDLKRWKTAEIEMPMDQTGVVYEGTAWETAWAGCTKPRKNGRVLMFEGRQWSEKNYLYPIPSDQLQLNPALEQNPGWN